MWLRSRKYIELTSAIFAHPGRSLISTIALYWDVILVVVVSVGGAKPIFWAPFLQRPMYKRKGGQVRFSIDQTLELEEKFNVQKYVSPQERKRLAKSLQLTERQVARHWHYRRHHYHHHQQQQQEQLQYHSFNSLRCSQGCLRIGL